MGSPTYDVVVIGAGLAGLLTGVLVARAGRSVAVLEARRVGDGTTGRSTAKVSLLQGTKLRRVVGSAGPRAARRYVDANREGQAWLRRFCDDHDVDYQVRPALTYATSMAGEVRARAEHTAARLSGLDVTWEHETELPFPVRGAVRLADQLQLDPGALLDAVVAELLAEGGHLFERTRVRDVRRADVGSLVITDEGTTAAAGTVVLATNQPILERHGFFARLRADRSYAAALSSAWVPHGMYLSAETPARSLRSLPVSAEEELLLVGGFGHPTGQTRSPQEHADRLLAWAREVAPGSAVTHTWSAQDQSPMAALPYVGPMLPRDHHVLLATGFDKWGFSNAPAAALTLATMILGDPPGDRPDWASAYATWTPREVSGLGRGLLRNARVAAELAGGYLGSGLRPEVTSTEGGVERTLSGRCTHLGGVVRWNDAERSWDCPLHGSRFAPDGSVLEGPATCGLREIRRG